MSSNLTSGNGDVQWLGTMEPRSMVYEAATSKNGHQTLRLHQAPGYVQFVRGTFAHCLAKSRYRYGTTSLRMLLDIAVKAGIP